MLAELSVRNFALIKSLNLALGPGLNVLTGETGAGKSIIVGAINLILGGRASNDLIRRGEDEAEVAALFLPEDPRLVAERLPDLGLEDAEEILVKRILTRSGRNRVYINGALSTLGQLAALGRELVAVSGQHEQQQLLDPQRQLLFLDQFGKLLDMREEMEAAYHRAAALRADADKLKRQLAGAREKSELYAFQAREIEEAALADGEDESLEAERKILRNAENIYAWLRAAYDRLYGEAGAVIEVLDAVRDDVGKAADLYEAVAPTAAQINDAFHQLDDAAVGLRDQLEAIEFNPQRLEEVEERLALIHRLKRKYGPELSDVIAFGRTAGANLSEMEDLERRLEEAFGAAAEAEEIAHNLAEALSRARAEAASDMSKRVADMLKTLGMPQVRFQVGFIEDEEKRLTPQGFDQVEYLIAPNLGEDLMPLAKIASGGELSRTMLGLKSLLAGHDKVQTVIFDEVDAGIGGGVAEVVGRKIKDLAAFHQLLCITHLPQIAVFGDHHHLVYKEVQGDRTVTGIRPLAEDDVIEEVARMMSGARPSAKSLEAAREMLLRGK